MGKIQGLKTNKRNEGSQKPRTENQNEKGKGKSWLSNITSAENSVGTMKEEKKNDKSEKKAGWFSFSSKEDNVDKKLEKDKKTDKFMRPINLNIDPNSVPSEITKKRTED